MLRVAEKRRHPRRRLDEDVLVTDVMRECVVGRLGDLSLGGLLLITEHPPREDALYQFRFELPDANGRRHPIEVGVHHVWSATLASGGSIAGFRIIDLAPEDERRIADFVERGHLAAS